MNGGKHIYTDARLVGIQREPNPASITVITKMPRDMGCFLRISTVAMNMLRVVWYDVFTHERVKTEGKEKERDV